MHVLIVDDDHTNLSLFSHLLKTVPHAEPVVMTNGADALAWCGAHRPDLVLLDYMMPGMDGLDFLLRFRALCGADSIPVIMITADHQVDVRHNALRLGANDFLAKPIDRVEFQVRVGNLLQLRLAQCQLAARAASLAEQVGTATRAIAAGECEMAQRLSRIAEYRDADAGGHLQRMARYTALVAAGLGLDQREQDLIVAAAPMHDIGKVGVADHILLKPGPLSDDEMALMRTHTVIGAEILRDATSPLLQAAAVIARSHHERYDGTGYPHGLRGATIPLHGRIVAVADVFDALTSARPYKAAWAPARAAALLRDGAGSHFDPRCVAAFLDQYGAVLAIYAQHGAAAEAAR